MKQTQLTSQLNVTEGLEQQIKSKLFLKPCFLNIILKQGKTMIDSMLLGSILNNSEIAYNLTKIEIEKKQQCHEKALRKLLSLPSKTPKQMLYLLTGSLPIKYLIQRRRLNYLHHIFNQDNESRLTFFFKPN